MLVDDQTRIDAQEPGSSLTIRGCAGRVTIEWMVSKLTFIRIPIAPVTLGLPLTNTAVGQHRWISLRSPTTTTCSLARSSRISMDFR